jgi:hypothetical protein
MIGIYKKLFVVIIALVLSACASLIPREHLIPKDQLVSTMKKQFPLHRGKGLFSITIDEPQLNLNPSQNRLGLSGHFTAHASLLEIDGNFTFSGKPQYHPEQRAVYFHGMSLDLLQINQGGMPELLRTEISHILNDYAASNPVYRLKPDELVVLGVKVEVEDIGVVSEGVLLKLRAMH